MNEQRIISFKNPKIEICGGGGREGRIGGARRIKDTTGTGPTESTADTQVGAGIREPVRV